MNLLQKIEGLSSEQAALFILKNFAPVKECFYTKDDILGVINRKMLDSYLSGNTENEKYFITSAANCPDSMSTIILECIQLHLYNNR